MNDVGHEYRRESVFGLSGAFSRGDARRSSEATDEAARSIAAAMDFTISDDKKIFVSLAPQDTH
jgi:hypothetical protein